MRLTRILFVVIETGLLVSALNVRSVLGEETGRRYGAGAKMWYVNPATEYLDPAFMWGPVASFDVSKEYWISGVWLQGEFRGSSESDSVDIDVEKTEQDAEIVFGRTFDFCDVGLGFRYASFRQIWKSRGTHVMYEESLNGGPFRRQYADWDTEDVWTADIFGPMAYIGFGSQPQGWPFGWHLGCSVMPWDLADNQGEHANAEMGLSYQTDRLITILSYRYKGYFTFLGGTHKRSGTTTLGWSEGLNYEHAPAGEDMTFHGVTASVMVRF